MAFYIARRPPPVTVVPGTALLSGSSTFTFTVASDENYLTVWLQSAPSSGVTAVTYDSVAMHRLGKITANSLCSEVWGLINPHTGSHSVVITGVFSQSGAWAFKNVGTDPATDAGTGDSFVGVSGGSTTAITGAQYGMLVGGTAASSNDPTATGATEGYSDNGGETVAAIRATGSSQQMAWTFGATPNVEIITISLSPVVGVSNQTVSPPVATATASSPTPVPQLQVPPAVTTASASSPVPVPQLRVSPAVTTASASAPLPTVTADSKVLAPAATASASAPVPVPQLKVSPAAATASASAPTPVPALGIPVPVATASANSPPAVPKLGVAPAVTTASASALVPVPQLVVVVPTKGTTVFGYSDQALGGIVPADIERLIGRKYNGFRQNADIPANWASTSAHNTQFNNGRFLSYRALQITTGLWTDINAGTYDSQLTAFASSIVGFGKWSPSNPFYVAFQHEATLPANTGLGTGQDFINAYRYVVDFFDAAGYTAVKKDGTANGGPLVMVLVHFERAFTNTLELGGTETPPAGLAHADFDPDGGSSPAPGGTTYYSGIGIDGYNAITSPGHLKYGTTASNLLGGVVAQAAATGKFTFFGEFACEDGTTTTDHTNKADWFDSVRAYISSLNGTPQQTRALLTTIKSSAENYNPDSSPQALAAYSRLALDSTFNASSATAFGMLPALPISVPVATASASALVPTVTATGADQTVSPPAATASASGPVPTVQLRISPAAATASASALTPTVTAASTVSPPAATAAASAPVPTVQIRVSPAAATANASAPVPVPQLRLSPAAATGSASALVPVPQLRVSPGVGTASASSPTPTVGTNPVVSPPVASASASAPTPGVDLRVLPPPVAPARFSRVNYGYCTSVAGGAAVEGARYEVMAMQTGDQSSIATLKTYNPRLRCMRYTDPVAVDPANPTDPNNTFTYTYVEANHPEWYLLDETSSRIPYSGSSNIWLLDLGNPALQAYALSQLLSVLASEGSWDGVFVDEQTMHIDWLKGAPHTVTTPDYSTDAKWQAAVKSFLTALGTGLKAAGYQMYGNIGAIDGDQSVVTDWYTIPGLTGQFYEEFAGANGGPRVDNDWLSNVQFLQSAETASKRAWCRTATKTQAGHRYGLATMLIASDKYSTWDAEFTGSGGGYGCAGGGSEQWFPEYDTAKHLGNATGAYFTVSSGTVLYRRDFERGSVIVNPHSSSASSYALGGTYSGSGFTSVTSITLAATSAAILTLDSADIRSASVVAPAPLVTAGSFASPPTATASASAPVPTVKVQLTPAVASASASALVPTVTASNANQTVSPPAATANASAPVPVPSLQVPAPAATASASAPVPTLQDRLLPPAGTASASAPVPSVQLRLAPAAATASASSPTPVPQVRVIVPAATASASAFAPTLSGQLNQVVQPPVATAAASAKVPTVKAVSLVSPPTAVAIAFAPTPGVIQKQWPQHSDTQWPPDSDIKWPTLTAAQWAEILGLQWPPDTHDQWE